MEVNIDASLSDFVLDCGDKDGKPHYIIGPHEDTAQQTAIVNQLANAVGEENFKFTRMVGSGNVIDYVEGDLE